MGRTRRSPDAHSLKPIPETDSVAGFKRWLDQTVGLDYCTFTASVLLQQGKSEAMLEADPRSRHQMLSQLIDLSGYQRLYERADERAKQDKAKKGAYEDELKRTPPVDDRELATLGEDIERLTEDEAKAKECLARLGQLKVHAANWARLVDDQIRVKTDLDEAEALVAAADQIEGDAARFTELERVLPAIEDLFDEQERLVTSQTNIETYTKQVQQRERALESARVQLEQNEQVNCELTTQREAQIETRDSARRELLALTPTLNELNRLDGLTVTLKELDEALATYKPDLDDRVAWLEHELARLGEVRAALPWLKRLSQVKSDWVTARSQAASVREKKDRLDAEIPTLEKQLVLARSDANCAQGVADDARGRVTEANTLLGEMEKRIKRFSQVSGKPTCDYCGQPLSPDHLDRERKRLDLEKEDISRALGERNAEFKNATAKAEELHQTTDRLASTLRERQDAQREAQKELSQADGSCQRDERSVEEIWHAVAGRVQGQDAPRRECRDQRHAQDRIPRLTRIDGARIRTSFPSTTEQ